VIITEYNPQKRPLTARFVPCIRLLRLALAYVRHGFL
jgi:hypothetical protein